MKKVMLGLVALILVSGCTTGKWAVAPMGGQGAKVMWVSNPDAVGQMPVAPSDGFWANHWGKVTSAAAIIGTGIAVGENNNWFRGDKRDREESISAPTGNDNTVVYVNNNTGHVDIHIGNTESK